MLIESLDPGPEHALPGELLTEITELYASNREFFALSGDFPDPDAITTEQVAAALADDLSQPGAEAFLARSGGRVVALALTMAHHPDPADPDPWLGLLLVDSRAHRSGHGRAAARAVEDHFRARGRTALRLAVLENNPKAQAFWTALGYAEIDRRKDRDLGRDCRVMRKEL
ncbi:GNAT family N-acetyltransferase [Streptomyces xanthii]|uniref:GNAT family N-acetyltransferase n=1 Tax=Streptomyces xanthii TaxID=2768069 RepID=A0A7H1B8B2_9ACTN|nr:GNAT family N-acetyltransferase [Streptomyces xanthii]QNS04967.1 GNAT family N-acetyltransferase [Streptomyces xanthii]